MSSTLVFNDASLPFQSTNECEEYLPLFFKILKRALKNQIQMIRTDERNGDNWYHFTYADNFSLSRWINEQPDHDYKRSLRMLMDKTCCPLIFPEEQEQLDAFDSSSFELVADNLAVPAIGSACVLNMPVVSFLSMPHWYDNPLSVKHEYIDGENIQQKMCEIENISQEAGLGYLLDRIQVERQQSKSFLKMLVKYDNNDYPNLIFCASILDTFKRIGVTQSLLGRIIDVLTRLNQAVVTASSVTEIIATTALSISGESDTTKNNPKLIKYRKFKLPDGELCVFDLHVKNFSGGQRLYFHPNFEMNKIWIGYFGAHLPI